MARDPKDLIGKFEGRLLIMGSAPCLWEDLEKYEAWETNGHDKMVINHVGILYLGSFQHWVSCHMDAPIFHPAHTRAAVHHEQDEEILLHGKQNAKDEAYGWDFKDRGSAMLGVDVGKAVGYKHITLAGVPLDQSGYFYGPPSHWNNFHTGQHRGVWKKRCDLKGLLYSMSGYTKNLFGDPRDAN